MQFIGIIPARYASTRFPGKPLVDIDGISMIRRVYEQAIKCNKLEKVVVATDDQRIFEHVKQFGHVVYTSEHHPSGTDRCFEAASLLSGEIYLGGNDVIVNIQGDEPYINPEQIDDICNCFERDDVQIATLVKKVRNTAELFDPNVVKVVTSGSGRALYFSRSPIPYARDANQEDWLGKGSFYRHIGMYAYRYKVLGMITKLPVSMLEKTESLEQLRWLENNISIHTMETNYDSIAVDTPDDLKKLSNHIR
jgi:3-deoxy-manno-octulosonate cytidylyltransferase (CMP-KDO synthetase)